MLEFWIFLGIFQGLRMMGRIYEEMYTEKDIEYAWSVSAEISISNLNQKMDKNSGKALMICTRPVIMLNILFYLKHDVLTING